MFWRSEQDARPVLSELFHLLSQTYLNVLSVNLDAYGSAILPCLRDFKLPFTITHLTISNASEPNLGFLRPCLHNLESLKLRSVSHGPDSDKLRLFEPLIAGSVFARLRVLEVDQANQLSALRDCALPALESLSVIALCRIGLEDFLLDFLLSLSPSNRALYNPAQSRHSAPILRCLQLRMTSKPFMRPSASTLYDRLLLHPKLRSLGVLSRLHSLSVVHNMFTSPDVQDQSIGELLATHRELQHFSWDVLLDTVFNQPRVVIGENVLRLAFPCDTACSGMRTKEITLRAVIWGMPAQKSWVRRYVATEHRLDSGRGWTTIDETRAA